MTNEISYLYHPLWRVLVRGQAYNPLPWQVQHLHSKVDEGYKRIILACGRRSGKSFSVKAEVAREVVKLPVTVLGVEHSPIVYIGGPNSETANRIWDEVWSMFVPAEDGAYTPPLGFLHAGHDKQRGLILIKGGAKIYKKTGESPVSWQGERVTLVVTDESQDMPEDVWEKLMPALLDSGGRLIAIGITAGKGRFRSYWLRGQGSDDNFYSASVSTLANPVIHQRAKEAEMDVLDFLKADAEGDLTEDEFARQYLAEWREEEGQVFSKFEHLFTEGGYSPEEAVNYGPHIMGLDLGKLHDYTVAYIGNVATQKIVARDRFNKIDYLDQVPKIAKMYNAYKCRFIHMDSTGIGEAVAEQLRAAGCNIMPFVFSNKTKQALVSTMVREVERGNVRFLANDDILKKEMTAFEGSISPGGVIKYSAPAGYFDDAVIAAALVISKMARHKTMAKNPIHKPYASFAQSGKKSYMPPLPMPKEAVA